MMMLKCKMCGGDVVVAVGLSCGTCDHCGSAMTLPRVSDERQANLFNRANHFRRLNEFDKAMAAYENILNEDATDSEAHWGVVLSRYGIEYVEDPRTHERLPTCHRVQADSILRDGDYLQALEHAPDSSAKELYQRQAAAIADIQKGILALSSQEEPFDVFICYKETSDGGSRTADSVLAQDLYHQLTQEKYRVFFSRITLENRLGQAYEPYIFAAINSAKVMVVLGTKPEHFTAVWVKNEWSRVISLHKKDSRKLLIPCYRDMNPFSLPEELSALQSQDRGKIGFLQDLVRGIKKTLEVVQPTAGLAVSVVAGEVTPLIKRARIFLEDGDFQSADEYAERVLDKDPECAEAYLVKLLAQLKLKLEEELGNGLQPLTENSLYQKACRYSQGAMKQRLTDYNSKRLEAAEAATNTIGMVLIEIPAGKFTMGDGEVNVTLTKPFFLGTTEVTQGQFKKVMGTSPWDGQKNVQADKDCPASYVSWDDATAFCEKLTDLERKDEEQLGQYAWFKGNTAGEQYAHKVGLKKPNPWGLHDMHGNLMEWCSDWYGEKLSGGTDPTGPEGGSYCVLRGGCWGFDPGLCRSADRSFNVGNPSFRHSGLGFRVARSRSTQ